MSADGGMPTAIVSDPPCRSPIPMARSSVAPKERCFRAPPSPAELFVFHHEVPTPISSQRRPPGLRGVLSFRYPVGSRNRDRRPQMHLGDLAGGNADVTIVRRGTAHRAGDAPDHRTG